MLRLAGAHQHAQAAYTTHEALENIYRLSWVILPCKQAKRKYRLTIGNGRKIHSLANFGRKFPCTFFSLQT